MNYSKKIHLGKYYRSCITSFCVHRGILYAFFALCIFFVQWRISSYISLLYVLLIIYAIFDVKKYLLLYLLSAKTFEILNFDEQEAVTNEYYSNLDKDKNEFGVVTQYALICGEGMASWQNITELAFRSKRVNWLDTLIIGISRDPCYMSVKACFNNKKYSWRVILPGNYDLAPKIEQFISEALSHNNRIFIDNEYYYN